VHGINVLAAASFNRWSQRGIRSSKRAFEAGGLSELGMIDSSAVRSSRSASGAKRGTKAQTKTVRATGARRKIIDLMQLILERYVYLVNAALHVATRA